MSKSDDQRTPDGTEPLPVDTDPTSDWAQRPTPPTPEQPTEQFGAPQYTGNPHEAYGSQPTQAYPTYDAYQQGQQASNPTQVYPTYDAYQQGQQASNPTQAYPTYDAYQQGQQASNPTQAYPTYDAYQQGQQPPNPTQAYPTAYSDPTAYADAGSGHPPQPDGPQPDDGKKGPGKGVLVAAITVAGLLLVAVVGIGAMLLTSGGDNNTTSASAPTTARTQPPATTAPPSAPRSTEPEIVPPDLSRIPGGVGEVIGAAGAAVGSVRSNDGGTLILDGIGGSQVTVTTDASTQVIALGASSVADLRVGETVLVQGDRGSDGTVEARMIISTTIPDFGDFGGN